MKQVVIENPIINSPFDEPQRHFHFDEEGITNQVVESRRESCYFVPIDQRDYTPDFLVRVDDGHGRDNPLNRIVEVSGQRMADKAAKVATARNLWVRGVNNAGAWGRWAFIEISDPWDVTNTIRALLDSCSRGGKG